MKISQVIDMAKNGELRSIAIKDNNAALIGYINLAMIELYKRFTLDTKEYLFERVVGVDEYTLPADNMWLVSAYGTIIRDNKLELSDLAINEEDNEYSINTISWNQIQVGSGIAAGMTSIIYVAAHVVYTESNLDDEIALPPQLLEPMLHYVGYRAHGSIDGNVQAENNTHYQRFEASCNRIRMQGMTTSDDVSMAARLNKRGFA